MTDFIFVSDDKLIDQLKLGNGDAFAEIYDRYIFVLLNHAYNKTRDREEAKDIVHEVFAALWAKREQLQIATNLSGYLYTSVRNIILNKIAHKGVAEKYFRSLPHFINEGQTITDHLIREKQLKDIIDFEISELPPKMREVFELSRRQCLTHKEIAEKLHIAEQTVSKQITNALKLLKLKLSAFTCLLVLILIGK